MIEAAIHASTPFVLKPSQVHFLNRIATEGVAFTPGVTRTGPIEISNTTHVPPPAPTVVPYLEEMCEYVNANWAKTPIHLGAYLLWRLNWIHPFEDGNGRTSRMIAYVVLCVRLGFLLPGTRTIPDQISSDKSPYYSALGVAKE
jgi:Fic family protein